MKDAHAAQSLSHEVVLSLSSKELYCTACEDYVYSSCFDSAIAKLVASQALHNGAQGTTTLGQESLIQGRLSRPPTAAAAHMDAHPSAAVASPSFNAILDDGFPAGLRGLNNMGNTCFMNSILQSLLHAPVFRNYFLLGEHTPNTCPTTSMGGFCVSCELDGIFSTAYSGKRAPMSPASFLHCWWSLAGGMLGDGYAQQDAHEFFLFILEMISSVEGPDNIASRIFGGLLRSDVTCEACGHTSTTHDPFTNVSLEIPSPTLLLPPPIIPRSNQHAVNGKMIGAVRQQTIKDAKKLTGAAQKAYLARITREGAADDALCDTGTPTPGGPNGSEGWEVTQVPGHGGLPSSTPHGGQLERASGIGVEGNTVDDGIQDTLASPGRGAKRDSTTIGPGRSASPEGGAPSETPSVDAIVLQGGAAAAVQDGIAATSTLKPSPSNGNHPALQAYTKWPGVSVAGCLHRFVKKERLGSGETWSCDNCQSKQSAVKQLSIRQLPPVLVLHAKRFEHSGGPRAQARKLETFLSFPLEDLDLKPFLSSSALRDKYKCSQLYSMAKTTQADQMTHSARMTRSSGNTVRPENLTAAVCNRNLVPGSPTFLTPKMTRSSSAGTHTQVPKDTGTLVETAADAARVHGCDAAVNQTNDFLYNLFAVVCHKGTFQGGHYVAYIKALDGKWYLCDDGLVMVADEVTVKNSQAYMLFYGEKSMYATT